MARVRRTTAHPSGDALSDAQRTVIADLWSRLRLDAPKDGPARLELERVLQSLPFACAAPVYVRLGSWDQAERSIRWLLEER